MRTTSGELLRMLAVVVAGLLVYHLWVGPGAAPPGAAPECDLADLERRIAALEEGGGPAPSLAGRAVDERLRRLGERLADLEARGPEPVRGPAWAESDVATFREGLRQVRVQEQREREAESFARQVAHFAPDGDEASRVQAVGVLVAYLADIRALSPPADAAPPTPEERRELGRRSEALRGQLKRDLQRIVGDDAAAKLAAAAPGGWPPAGATGPPVDTRPR